MMLMGGDSDDVGGMTSSPGVVNDDLSEEISEDTAKRLLDHRSGRRIGPSHATTTVFKSNSDRLHLLQLDRLTPSDAPDQQFLKDGETKVIENDTAYLSVLSAISGTPGSYFFGIDRGKAVVWRMPEDRDSIPHRFNIKMVVDQRGYRRFYFSVDDEWLSFDVVRWGGGHQVASEVKTSVSNAMNWILLSGRLFVNNLRKHFDETLASQWFTESMLNPDATNLPGYLAALQKFSGIQKTFAASGYRDLLQEMAAFDSTFNGVYENHLEHEGVNIESFAVGLAARGVKSFLVRILSTGRILALDERFIGQTHQAEDEYQYRLRFVEAYPGVFQIFVRHNETWREFEAGDYDTNRESIFRRLLFHIFRPQGLTDDERGEKTQLLDLNRYVLLNMAQRYREYIGLQMQMQMNASLEPDEFIAVVQYLLQYAANSQYFVDPTLIKLNQPEEYLGVNFLAAVMSVHRKLFEGQVEALRESIPHVVQMALDSDPEELENLYGYSFKYLVADVDDTLRLALRSYTVMLLEPIVEQFIDRHEFDVDRKAVFRKLVRHLEKIKEDVHPANEMLGREILSRIVANLDEFVAMKVFDEFKAAVMQILKKAHRPQLPHDEIDA